MLCLRSVPIWDVPHAGLKQMQNINAPVMEVDLLKKELTLKDPRQDPWNTLS